MGTLCKLTGEDLELILEAFDLISTYCNSQDNCKKCIFRKVKYTEYLDSCSLMSVFPCSWHNHLLGIIKQEGLQ